MAEFVIADTHFGHKNIIEYTQRPFKTVEKMDAELIARWNSVVDVEDTVYHLGDFAIGASKSRLQDLVWRLNGQKILFLGDHDDANDPDTWQEIGFDKVYPEPMEFETAILSHRPLRVETSPKPNWHGHTHVTVVSGLFPPKYVCFCVEKIGYTPVRLEQPLGELIGTAAYLPYSDYIVW